MKARLKVLLDELRGGAWPSPVRAVRCLLKCSNERDPHALLPPIGETLSRTLGGPPLRKWRKVGATAGQYAPDLLGHTRAAMVETMGSDPEKGR